jgi:hypothetical protein
MSHITEREQRVADLMSKVYAAGGRFAVSKDGTRLGVGGDKVPPDLRLEVLQAKDDIIDVLTQDPLDGDSIGWGVRSCFYRKLLAYVDSQVEGDPEKKKMTDKALFNSDYLADLSKLTLNATFNEYRGELLRLMRRVLEAAETGEIQKSRAFRA